jgi:hypothetical protein
VRHAPAGRRTAYPRTSRGWSASSSGSGTRSRRRRQAQAKLTQIARLEKERSAARQEIASLTTKRREPRLRLPRPAAQRPHRPRSDDVGSPRGTRSSSRARARRRARREGRARRAERRGQDDRSSRRSSAVIRSSTARSGSGTGRAGLLLAARARAPRHGFGARCDGRGHRPSRPKAQALLGRFLFSGWETHERAVTRALRGRAAAARPRCPRRVRCGTSSSWTSRRTTSTSSRGRRSKRARGVPGNDAAGLARPRAARRRPAGSSRSRDSRCTRYDGGWADLERERSSAGAAADDARRQAARASRSRPTARSARRRSSSCSRARSQRVEDAIAELERTLAEDWTNADVLGAHRAARDELVALLERWEALFGEARAT